MLSKWNSFLCRGLAVTGREERQLVQKQGPENRYKPSNFPHCLRLAFIWEISVDMDWFFKVWAILSGLHEVGSSLELWLTFAIFQGRHFNPYFVLYTHEVPIVEWSHFFFFEHFFFPPQNPPCQQDTICSSSLKMVMGSHSQKGMWSWGTNLFTLSNPTLLSTPSD